MEQNNNEGQLNGFDSAVPENGELNRENPQTHNTPNNAVPNAQQNSDIPTTETANNNPINSQAGNTAESPLFTNSTNNGSTNAAPNEGYTVTPSGSYYNAGGTTPPYTGANGNGQAPFGNAREFGNNGNTQNTPPKDNRPFSLSGDYGNTIGGDPNTYHYARTPQSSYYSSNGTPPKPQKPQKAPKEPRKKRGYGIGSLIAVALITAICCSGCFFALTKINPSSATNSTSSKNVAENSKSTQKTVKIDGSIEELAKTASQKAGSSVVGVQTTFAVQSFFSGNSTSTGSGSGVIYKSDGYIITNYHVIADTLETDKSSIKVFLDNNSKDGYEASVINYNISCDLAVLKIDKTGLDAIDIANSDNLEVGQYVIAIGSPGGLEFMGSTTFGIISGLNRKVSTTNGDMTLIQTDAAINPGNSGGALVNAKGELVGINNSKLVSESYEGMGFAIPVNTVVKICDNLIAHEGEGSAYTGISISSNYTSDILKHYGYPVGAVVAAVDQGSPAEKAGIRRGDIITKFGDTVVDEYTKYEAALSGYYPKDTVKVSFYRSGKTKTVKLTIGSSK